MSSNRRWRIAVGGLHTECSTYNPVLMREPDFRVLRGAAMLAHPEYQMLDAPDAAFLPTIHARAIAGGPIARATYEAFRAEFLDALRALGPVDGLYLAMHGAACVAGMEDAEADWIEAACAVVGRDCRVAASYDLHGNLSQRIIDRLDIFAAYRTAPHIDVDSTKRRAVGMLLRALREGVRPHLRWAPVPVLLPGERTSTELDPARGLYASLPGIDARPGIWDASLIVGYVWADEPRATACAVLTGTDAAAMDEAAEELARDYWNARDAFGFCMEAAPLAECLDRAARSTERPVIIADSGDNPTGGGVGDRADVLAALIARGTADALIAGIADAPATEACIATGIGARLALRIGGTLDPSSVPADAVAEVLFLDPAEQMAVVGIAGITLVLTARRRPFHNIADFARLGLDPRAVRLLVVKSGYLSPELALIARPGLLALTPGVVDQDVARLPIRHVRRPTFPFDRDFAFAPVVRPSARLQMAHA